MRSLVSMAADLIAVKPHINLRRQKLHLSSVVTRKSHTALEKYQDSVLFPAWLKEIFIEVSSFHSVCSVSNIKRSACAFLFREHKSLIILGSILCAYVHCDKKSE